MAYHLRLTPTDVDRLTVPQIEQAISVCKQYRDEAKKG